MGAKTPPRYDPEIHIGITQFQHMILKIWDKPNILQFILFSESSNDPVMKQGGCHLAILLLFNPGGLMNSDRLANQCEP